MIEEAEKSRGRFPEWWQIIMAEKEAREREREIEEELLQARINLAEKMAAHTSDEKHIADLYRIAINQ